MAGMAAELILLVEKEGSKAPTFAAALQRKGYTLDVVTTGSHALKRARALNPVVIILNAASLGSSGSRICRALADEFHVPVIHILPESDASAIAEPSCEIMLSLPFTPRKLINRIKQLMPAGRKEAIVVGPLRLAPAARIVEAHGRETRLTPKAASLLEVFLKHPGETLDRGYLMRQVWDTNYVGDTRTLDVHVRWVREAVEPDPHSPRHIVTVRGIGYRFEPGPFDTDHHVPPKAR